MKVHPVFNVVKPRPFLEDTIAGRKAPPRPKPVIEGSQPEWEVEYIKDSRVYRNKLQYLVKWKGYPQEESTWEPYENLEHSKKIIHDFHIKHPSAPRKISVITHSRLPFQPYTNFTEVPESQHLFDWTLGKHIEGNVP